MTKKILLEISVDRLNEKGVFIAEQILSVLHNTLEESKILHFWHRIRTRPDFSFEIANINGVVRFFFRVEEGYRDFLESQIYAHFPAVEIRECVDYIHEDAKAYVGSIGYLKEYYHPIRIYTSFKDRTEKESIDPFSSITSAIASGNHGIRMLQVNFAPAADREWKSDRTKTIAASGYPRIIKKILLSKHIWILKAIWWPIKVILKSILLVASSPTPQKKWREDAPKKKDDLFEKKFEGFGYRVGVNVGYIGDSDPLAKIALRELGSALTIFTIPGQNGFNIRSAGPDDQKRLFHRTGDKNLILSTAELAGLVHLPTVYVKTPGINWVTTKTLEPPPDLPLLKEHEDATPIGVTNFRGTRSEFGILPDDKRRHVYIIGKTGMGKSVLLENMIYSDIMAGRGVGLIDPHGDLADTILENIPKSRTNDVILFDPSDYKHPIAFNMFDNVSREFKPIVASGIIGIFKKMFAESWGPRLEHILRNTIMTLLEVPDATLMSIPMMLTHKSFRLKTLAKVKDPMMLKFWESEFEILEQKQMTEAVSPILNKVGQFLSSPLLRNILGQPKNPFTLRWAMDNRKILIVNLSKGKIGEDSSALLGSMMVTKFQIEAMTRADIPEAERKDFYLYVDEFQNFATDSFATILSEARKYKLNLTVANQYIEQMTDMVRGAVFGNVGSIMSFQVGYEDASKLAETMGDEDVVSPTDFTNLKKYTIYTKLLIGGMPSRVFSAGTFPPIRFRNEGLEQKKDTVLRICREKYAKPVEFVENKIKEVADKAAEDEKKLREREAAFKERMKEEKLAKKASEKASAILSAEPLAMPKLESEVTEKITKEHSPEWEHEPKEKAQHNAERKSDHQGSASPERKSENNQRHGNDKNKNGNRELRHENKNHSRPYGSWGNGHHRNGKPNHDKPHGQNQWHPQKPKQENGN